MAQEAQNPEAEAEAALKQTQVNDLQELLKETEIDNYSFKPYTAYSYSQVQKTLQEEDPEAATQNRAAPPTPIYFYHPDHLGTSTFLTDANGNAYQFFLNLPFGETMAEQKGSLYYNTPYKFNGKELDEETGLYYYGARYYDPRISIWLSVDPLAEKYPSWSPYNYTFDNPVNYTDPTGMEAEGMDNEWPPKCWISIKNWWKGNDNYRGSGWGHGARQEVAKRLGVDNKASNVAEVGVLSQLQFSEVEIVGQAREKIKNDPAMVSNDDRLVERAKDDPGFGKKAFSFKNTEVIEFGGRRAPENMSEQLKDPFNPKYSDTWSVAGNELTWLVRHATVESVVAVDKKGNITINHTLTDQFDLRPSSGRSGAYNNVNKAVGTLYHDLLGGNDNLILKSRWTTKK